MHDDPFARAVERAQEAEQAQQASRRKRRRERLSAGSRTAFRIHATMYVTVNVLLVAIWASTWQFNDATSYPWFIYPLLAWGVGLAAHYAAARNLLIRRAEQPRPEVARPSGGLQPTAPSTAEELTRLADLHRSGALSDEEFSAAKAKLLE